MMCSRLLGVLSLLSFCGGCGPGKPYFEIGFNLVSDPGIGQPGKATVRIQMGKPGEQTWAGRTMKVTIQPDPELVVDPLQADVTLDQTGSGQMTLSFTSVKTSTKEAYPLTITVTGPENFSSSLPAEVYVNKAIHTSRTENPPAEGTPQPTPPKQPAAPPKQPETKSGTSAAPKAREFQPGIAGDIQRVRQALLTSGSSAEFFQKQAPARIAGWRQAAEKGSAEAQWLFGRCLNEGTGVEKDMPAAMRWYRKSAEQGFALARNSLGYAYEHGEGVEADGKEAAKWYRLAADQNEAIAQHNLGRLYTNGKGVEEAVKWFRRAAEQTLRDAQFDLGWMYEFGLGVDRSPKEAVRWYQLASDQGEERGTVRLAVMYEDGIGVDKDPALASRFRERARQQLGHDAEEQMGRVAIQMNPIGKRALKSEFTIEGKPVKLADSQGRVVVLVFGASWCRYCREVAPHHKELAKRLKNESFALLDVDIDKNPTQGSHWGVNTVPAIYVIDSKGIVRFTGSRGESLDRAVDTLLKEAKGSRSDKK